MSVKVHYLITNDLSSIKGVMLYAYMVSHPARPGHGYSLVTPRPPCGGGGGVVWYGMV